MLNKMKLKTISLHIILSIYAVISLYPLLWMLFYSLKNNDEIFVTNPFGVPTVFRVGNYIKAWTEYNILGYFKNSLIVSLSVVAFTLIIALMFSYATSRLEWKYSTLARMILLLGMFIPVQTILVPLLSMVRTLHLANTYVSLIIPNTAFQLSLSTLVFHGFFKTIPKELEEAAYIDGAGIFKTFISIIVPTIKPAVATVSIFVFLSAWNEFVMSYILISDEKMKTLPLGLLSFQGAFNTDWGAMGASLVIASIPTIIFYILFSEQVERAMGVSGAVK